MRILSSVVVLIGLVVQIRAESSCIKVPHLSCRIQRLIVPVLPLVFSPVPLGTTKPNGWLEDQLQLIADGLGGHERDFYRYVKDSSWTGGDQEYSTLNEAWPYWLNGIVPLAYSLDDERLKEQVKDGIDYVFEHQWDDGWLGPEGTNQKRMFWPRTLFLMAVTQYLEAEPKEAERLVPNIYKFLELSKHMLEDDYLGYVGREDSAFDYRWGIVRSHDMILSLQWLYQKYPQGNEELLLDIMRLLNEKAWDWAWFYSDEVFPKGDLELDPPKDEELFWFYHGVNSAMGMKAGAVVRRFTHNETLLEITRRGVDWTFRFHGSPSGSIIVGLSPTRGSELCTTVEAMYSLTYLYSAIGDKNFADRAELAAFNALPAAVAPDWWSHQYVTQINQPFSYNLSESPFNNVGPTGQTYGLEPDYPCCTVNHPQGQVIAIQSLISNQRTDSRRFPKLLSAAYVKIGEKGIGHAVLLPSSLSITLNDGNEVSIRCDTTYPFSGSIRYIISSTKSFDFHIRVPEWAILGASYIAINDGENLNLNPDIVTGFHQVFVFSGITTISYTIGAKIVIKPRANDTVTIYHGSLLYALDIEATIQSSWPIGYKDGLPVAKKWTTPHARDHTYLNIKPWNIAIDPNTLKYHTAGDKSTLRNPIFSSSAPPGYILGKGCQIAWGLFRGTAAPPPPLEERQCLGDFFEVKLIPYGAAKLHMAELPTINSNKSVSKKLLMQEL
ncbi:hypothetical protein B0O99DRAFT_518418 [Bisporella sp. PMI_857]|nr:hypothetical protein B0O99DRAFT_518418 [Bisporella sp. PMI_857]